MYASLPVSSVELLHRTHSRCSGTSSRYERVNLGSHENSHEKRLRAQELVLELSPIKTWPTGLWLSASELQSAVLSAQCSAIRLEKHIVVELERLIEGLLIKEWFCWMLI